MHPKLKKRRIPVKEQTVEEKIDYLSSCLSLSKIGHNQRQINKCLAQIDYLIELIQDPEIKNRAITIQIDLHKQSI